MAKNYLNELHRYANAGSQSGDSLSPFKITAYNVRVFLRTYGVSTMIQIVDSVDYHYASKSSAKRCIATGIMEGWIEGVIREGNLYKIDPEYKEEVDTSTIY